MSFLQFLSRSKQYLVKALGFQSKEEPSSFAIPYDKLEKLYTTDPLVWACIEEYVRGLASDFVLEGGEDQERIRLEEWLRNSGFVFAVQDGVRDLFIYGNWWLELVPDYDNAELKFKRLNPKTMDYIRDGAFGVITRDENGEPLGIVQTVGLSKIEWYRDKITTGDGDILLTSRKEDLRKRICHFTLYTLPDEMLGYTPLLGIYKSAIIRLNLSETIGETGFRGGGIVAYIKGKPSAETVKNLEDALKNLTSKNVFILEDAVKLDTVPIVELSGREKLIYYLADEIATGLGVPLGLLMSGELSRQREFFATKFEEGLKPLQQRVAYQIRDKVFSKFWEVNGFKGEIPRLVFVERTPFAKLNRSRTIATLARRGLISYDPELEERLRAELGLPVSFVRKAKDKWVKEDRIVEPTVEIDKGDF